MELKIIYDNGAKKGFKSGWGFSCLVDEHLLFDVGADSDTLLFNMRRFDIDLSEIDKVFLSHEHSDHIGGIHILDMLGDVKVYAPRSFSNRFKRLLTAHSNVDFIEIGEASQISGNFYSTGEMGRFIKEQSLIIKKGNKLTIVTGCSHPGLENILNKASKLGEIYGVIGGFHGFSKLEKLRDLHLIVPCHCTARKREMLKLYPEKCRECSAGCRIEI